jgi:hypothetical protein
VAEGGGRSRLGAGRSGEVFLEPAEGAGDEPGEAAAEAPLAVKVFGGDPLATAVHVVLSGAPNPYSWDEDAVRAAEARRVVVALLARAWFGDRLVVSRSVGVRWDDGARAWALETEYVDGAPVRLLHPLRDADAGQRALRRDVMTPLQERLREAGLDGLVWQAGLGNPVASSNFLQLDDGRFALIDLESGVPALFPADPRALARFYLPRAVAHGHALFDDADLPRLRRYLEADAELPRALGEQGMRELRAAVDALELHQRRWRDRGRVERGVTAQLVRGQIDGERAEHYLRHPWRFRAREVARGGGAAARAAARVPGRLDRWLFGLGWAQLPRGAWRFVTSQEHRTGIAQGHVERRIDAWEDRGQLSADDAARLRAELADEASSAYLSDFGAHLGLKATFQLLELTLLSLLVAVGVVPLWLFAAVVAADGLLYRTAYTLYRSARELAARRAPPWVALLVGLAPLLGSLAFPAQVVWSAKEREELVMRFVVTDLLTRLGAAVPIWGGEDTLTEHALNRLGHRLVRRSVTA